MGKDATSTGASNGGTNDGTTPPDPTPAFEPITSQEQLNRIIGERLERERAKYADYDALKERAARADELEAASRTVEQKAAEEKAAAEKRAAEAEARVLRREIALEHKLSPDDAKLLDKIPDEETMRSLAARLAPQPSADSPTGGGNGGGRLHVPGLGKIPEAPASLEAQIAAAEAEGDHARVLRLKTQKLLTLQADDVK